MSTRQARKMQQAADANGSDDQDAEELARQANELAKAERKPTKATGFAAMMMQADSSSEEEEEETKQEPVAVQQQPEESKKKKRKNKKRNKKKNKQ